MNRKLFFFLCILALIHQCQGDDPYSNTILDLGSTLYCHCKDNITIPENNVRLGDDSHAVIKCNQHCATHQGLDRYEFR